MAKKIVLTHSNLARVASGVPIGQVEHEVVEDPPEGETGPAPAAETPGSETSLETPPASNMGGGEAPAAPAAPAAATGEETPVVPAEGTELVSFLKEELATSRQSVAELQVTNLQLETQLNDSQANSAGLLACALDGAARLQVILGQTPLGMEGLPVATVTSQYAKFKKDFETRFKVGQQSLGSGETQAVDPTKVALQSGLRPVG
jgi:hypothetical protein